MSSDIPLARQKLEELAQELTSKGDHRTAAEILRIVHHHMVRKMKQPSMKTRKLKKIDRDKALRLSQGTDLSVQEIADRMGLAPRVVHEIINGE